MNSISLEEAQVHLADWISRLRPGEELLIVHNNQPVARLIGERPSGRRPRQAGSAIGKLTIVQEDDEHLEDFREYMT